MNRRTPKTSRDYFFDNIYSVLHMVGLLASFYLIFFGAGPRLEALVILSFFATNMNILMTRRQMRETLNRKPDLSGEN